MPLQHVVTCHHLMVHCCLHHDIPLSLTLPELYMHEKEYMQNGCAELGCICSCMAVCKDIYKRDAVPYAAVRLALCVLHSS